MTPALRTAAVNLVAACFLGQYGSNPDIDPAVARQRCCTQWYGDPECQGVVKPDSDARLKICILAQIDRYFDDQKVAPMCSVAQADYWCRTHTAGTFDPCIEGHGTCYAPSE